MKKFRQGFVPAALIAVYTMVGFVPASQAHSMPGPKPAGASVVERSVVEAIRDGVSVDDARRKVERQYNGKVVQTQVQDEDGRKVYVFKVLREDNRVFIVRVDAQTGRSR